MRRRMFRIAVLTLGICTVAATGVPGAAWGLTPLPPGGRSDPGAVRPAGEKRLDDIPGPVTTITTDGPSPPGNPLRLEGASPATGAATSENGGRSDARKSDGPRDDDPTDDAPASRETREEQPSQGSPAPETALPSEPATEPAAEPAQTPPAATVPEPSAPAPQEAPAGDTPSGEKAPTPTPFSPETEKGTAEVIKRGLRLACPPTSVICLENSLPGNPSSQWDIPGAGSSNIQGYTTQMSVNIGQTVQFKVKTNSTNYRIDIYRIGYYGGMGARQITTILPSASLPQTQPACVTDSATQLVDCGNWAVSASWAVPATAVSGVYIANLIRQDGTTGASQMVFVVRDDSRGADVLIQTSDATWQAYNTYGGSSLYQSSASPGRAFKVSYNRPFTTRGSSCCNGSVESWFFNSEYPLVRWMEANGYDVSYTSSIDTASQPAELLEHKIFISSGHDEYWSNEMRANVQNAQANGINVIFLSGNETFWKTRWENSIDGTSTPYRTIVCYKETLANAKIDPSSQWTGTWRDPRFSPPSDGGRPENAVTGTFFQVNGVVNDTMTVPAEYGDMRLWRNTSIATLPAGQIASFPAGTLGYEWDEAPENATTPPGLVRYSQTPLSVSTYLLDFGGTYGSGSAVHHLTLYKEPSGALVFGAGTTQWAWGLDANHDRAGSPTDINMQQATVNLLADMNTQPVTLQAGLVPATPSTDTTPPTSAVTTPVNGASVPTGTEVAVTGTATDTGGGVVGGVEVSFDNGTTWFQATGRSSWSYGWTPTVPGPATITVRAVDDSGNIQSPLTTSTVNVTVGCPCSLWSPTATPDEDSHDDPTPVEGGVKFTTASSGFVTSIRFYKGELNTGTHVGSLWTIDGQLLATATFTNETASGWQQVEFSAPVQIVAGTTYVASYHTTSGFYSVSRPYFTTALSNGPITALADGTSGGNGVYAYAANTTFPTGSFDATNYWVDVVFELSNSLWDNTAVPDDASHDDSQAAALGVKFTANQTGTIRGIRFYKGELNTGTHVGSLWTSDGQLLASATFTNETVSGWQQVNFSSNVPITAGTTYVASYYTPSGFYSVSRPYFTTPLSNGPLTALADGTSGGNGVYGYGDSSTFPTNSFDATNYWVDVVFAPSATLWSNLDTPAIASNNDPQPVTLGVKFTSSTTGIVRGIRFFKGPQNTGTHVGSLWTSGGQLLATATFTNETPSGWQQVSFSTPVQVTAGTTYVASYYTSSGYYSLSRPYFISSRVNGPLTAFANGIQGNNGVYTYGSTSSFPTGDSLSANYWVDVVFDYL
ncbi:DUF4082 domain-containing protein [Streptosporangium sp. NPDC051022]|uniref:DUF4082 domain-containing protein n=1 Tax=Streptosporangium sp. NPDC051022 TaxID=3155752 RepID=UPI0034416268